MLNRYMLAALGLFHIGNGLWMLAAPMSWYGAIPGVRQTGPLNHHFVADIGLAFLASGTGLLLGVRKRWAAFAVAGATWPALHALLHIVGWMENGFPARPDIAFSEVVGVVLVGAVGAAVSWQNFRISGDHHDQILAARPTAQL